MVSAACLSIHGEALEGRDRYSLVLACMLCSVVCHGWCLSAHVCGKQGKGHNAGVVLNCAEADADYSE